MEFDLAFRVLRPDGTIRHLRSRSRSIEDDVGGRQGYVWTVEDITELRTTLENLAISEQRFSRLYESTPAMLHSIDAQGLLLTVSDRWLQVLGYQRSEVIGRRSTEFLTEASQAQAKVVLAEYFKEGRCDHIAYQMVTKAGAVIDVLLSAVLERNLAGEPLRSMAIIEDVTERNAAMRESNALLDTIRSQFIMSITDAAGSIIEVNDAFCGISQFTRHELMGSNHRIVNSKNHSPAFFEDMWSTISSGLPWKGVICNRAKDGTLYWVDSVIAPLLGSNGKVERYVSIRRDVTERVKQSRAIEAANTRITLATDSGGIGIWDFDVTQGTLMWDDWMYRLYGADKDAGVGTYDLWARHLHPDDKAAAEQAVQSAINGPEGLDIEFRIIRPDGRICHLRGTAKVTRDRSGRATRMVGASWDVTKLRQLSAELAEQHELLQVTLQSIGDAVITTDAQQRITWLNPVAQRMTGWSPNDAIGVPLTEVFHIVNERTRAPVTSPIASCLELQRTVELSDHNLLVSRDGKEFSIEDTAAPIRNERGELLGAVLVFHDVTRQRQQQKQVERALSGNPPEKPAS